MINVNLSTSDWTQLCCKMSVHAHKKRVYTKCTYGYGIRKLDIQGKHKTSLGHTSVQNSSLLQST